MRRRARLALDHLGLEGLGRRLDHRDVVTVRIERAESFLHVGHHHRGGLDQAVRHDEVSRGRPEVGPEARRPALEFRQRAREPVPASFGQLPLRAGAVANIHVLDALAHEDLLELRFLLHIRLGLPQLDAVERRHGDVDMSALDKLLHLAVEEGEDQRPDVRAVHVCVGHDDHSVVTELRDVELVADAGSDRGDHRLDLEVREHLVDPVLFGVDDLPAQRQDRLEETITSVDRRAAGRVALHEEKLGGLRIVDLAVGELAG